MRSSRPFHRGALPFLTAALAGWVCATPVYTARAATAPSRPNIIFILIDDMGWRDLSCYGSTFYETPNINGLATTGMRFSDAYAACPVCSPTRASLLTGKYPARVGVTNFIGGHAKGKLLDAPYIHHLPLTELSLAKALHQGGYQTWHLGKWHLGDKPFYPEHQGFDVNIGGCEFGHQPSYFSPYHIPTLRDGPPGEFLTDRLTDEAIKLIEHANGKPFFMNLWHYAVHMPIQAPAALVEKYKAKAHSLGLDQREALKVGEPFPTRPHAKARVTRRLFQSDPTYAALIENLDTNVGRLMAALDRCGLTNNTIVIFSSDNGGLATAEGSPTTNAPLAEGKGWMYDGGVREPLIVKWPGVVQPGSICHQQVTSPDFYPTLLECAGLPLQPQQHVDGVSFLPLLRGGTAPIHDAIFWHYPHYGNQGGTPGCSIRSGDWKLIEFFEDHHLELYNLHDDQGEHHNMAKQHPDIANTLHAKLIAWRESVKAVLPDRNPDWPD